ncbi:hypothetical protein LTR78_001397 [Recurvomyces mirabilis]|uniref:NACHT domain-containing protein n=1 Tax=Recurvomyces mirabilis TaxID=574656 RepID=A0AAE1C5K6_9PEZI|nr:hypothetical protein LTR78_001397 [Recurvomyces mirabilis]KAK5161374.1 hypothetical protein LTS14_001170 [Recurvomyces mirabilis]
MFDLLTALSIAAAVVQFVDYGSDIVGTTYRIYKSADGALDENVDTERIIIRLRDISQELTIASSLDNYGFIAGEKQLQATAGDCQKVAKELLDMLQELAQTRSRFKTWDAMRKALKAVRQKDYVEKLQIRLECIKSQMASHLLQILGKVRQCQQDINQQSRLASALRHHVEVSENLKLGMKKDLEDAKRELVGSISEVQTATSQIETEIDDWGQLLLTKMDAMSDVANRIATSKDLLDSLHFTEMPMRHIQIPVAYADTNSWIFEAENGPFRNWLEASSGIFWIGGRAGSGKSTLVKFLADHKRTRRLLRKWAKIRDDTTKSEEVSRLAIASYYFWNSGFSIQKSLGGLLQSLLYQIFHQCPSLLRSACTQRWEALESGESRPDSWTTEELSKAMDALLLDSSWTSHFCFFIDGLDEYEGTSGEQHAMVKGLDRLAAHPCAKVCVSSRPWNVFRTAYDKNESHRLLLQDHNRADLDTYISGKLEADDRFKALAASDERASAFALEIRQKANGVLLWVFLVARSLLDGLTEEDDIHMLQVRLDALPPSLEDYFALMLKSIDAAYRKYTARALLLACHATQPLPTLAYYHLNVELNNPHYAIKAPVQTDSSSELDAHRRGVISWINKWCRDLLEVSPIRWGSDPLGLLQDYRVDFLHRTVRDFLADEGMQTTFARDAGADYNPRLSLCRSYLMLAKAYVSTSSQTQGSEGF